MVRRGPPCKLVRREPVETRVRSLSVVIRPPASEHLTGMRQAAEDGLVQQLVAQATVEALDEAVLHRLARRNVVPADAGFLLPAQDRRRSELGAVVADDQRRLAAPR